MSHHSRQRKVGYTKFSLIVKRKFYNGQKNNWRKLRGDTNAIMIEMFQTCSRDNLETKAVTSWTFQSQAVTT